MESSFRIAVRGVGVLGAVKGERCGGWLRVPSIVLWKCAKIPRLEFAMRICWLVGGRGG